MRLASTRRLGLVLLGVAAVVLSPSALALDPPADGEQVVAADAQPQPAPAPVAPAPADEQPAPPPDAPAPGEEQAPGPTDEQPPPPEPAAADAPPPADAQPPADEQPAPADPPAADPPADAQPPADAPADPAAAAPPADGQGETAAPVDDGPAPSEPPPPPAAAAADQPAAAPGQPAGEEGWGWEAQCIGQYLQCGGQNYWGPTNCCEGHDCEYVNDYWWQCNPVPGWVPPAEEKPAPAATAPEPTLAPTRKPHHWGHHHNHTSTPTLAPTPFPTEGGPPFWESDCFRTRKNILNLTPEELADFIEGLQVLKANGVYDNITAIHGNASTFGLFHGNDFFLPWHRWYVLQIESAVRALGGKWSCFAMPYWDWTLDAGREMQSPIWNIFGPMGKKNDSFCMREGPWAEWKNSKGGCLKRIGSDSYRFFSPAEVMDLILNKPKLVKGFRPAFEAGAHSRPHLFIGGAMNSFASPDDPIFWLHHTMVDKVWAMWQDCHQLLDPLNLSADMFNPEELDVELAYFPGITTRSVWSVRELGYTYETDIMSAYTFLDVCHWFNLKPNPGIDLNLPSPPMPARPAETRIGGPEPSVSPIEIADGADTASAFNKPPSKRGNEGKPSGTGTIGGIMEQQQTPNLRGHKGKGNSHSSHKPSSETKGNSSTASKAPGGDKPSIASTRAAAFFPAPQEATKEWATAQAAVAPFEPHGKGLIVEENRIYVTCMARVARGEEPGWTRKDCMRAVLMRDCELLGYICDLPPKYKEGMFAEEAERVFKQDSVCARTCKAPDTDMADMG